MLVKNSGMQKSVFCYAAIQVTLKVNLKLLMLCLMILLLHILSRFDKIPVNP